MWPFKIKITAQAQVASAWWAERFFIVEKRDAFRDALEKILSSSGREWRAYNDYDPSDTLFKALKKVGLNCRGHMYSGSDFFPEKTGIILNENGLFAKEGRLGEWVKLDVK